MTSHHRSQDHRPTPDGETLCALFDGQLQGDAARFALKRLGHDAQWRQACGRWQLYGDVMRGQAAAVAPAGFADRVALAMAGEAPLAAARRELMEELGLIPATIESLGAFVTNANQGCNTAHLYLARGCQIVAEPTVRDLEDSEIVLMDRAALAAPDRLQEIGLAAHVTLLLLALRAA